LLAIFINNDNVGDKFNDCDGFYLLSLLSLVVFFESTLKNDNEGNMSLEIRWKLTFVIIDDVDELTDKSENSIRLTVDDEWLKDKDELVKSINSGSL
jgi:hypothetical protein